MDQILVKHDIFLDSYISSDTITLDLAILSPLESSNTSLDLGVPLVTSESNVNRTRQHQSSPNQTMMRKLNARAAAIEQPPREAEPV